MKLSNAKANSENNIVGFLETWPAQDMLISSFPEKYQKIENNMVVYSSKKKSRTKNFDQNHESDHIIVKHNPIID